MTDVIDTTTEDDRALKTRHRTMWRTLGTTPPWPRT